MKGAGVSLKYLRSRPLYFDCHHEAQHIYYLLSKMWFCTLEIMQLCNFWLKYSNHCTVGYFLSPTKTGYLVFKTQDLLK